MTRGGDGERARGRAWLATILCGGTTLGLALGLMACSSEGSSAPTERASRVLAASPSSGGAIPEPPVAASTAAPSAATPPVGTAPAGTPSAPPDDDRPPLRAYTTWSAEGGTGTQRVKGAEERRADIVRELFEQANVSFPPAALALVGYKREKELEVWAGDDADGELTMVTRYAVCAASGDEGPKRQEGDRQVPEGLYRISYFNAQSQFHLSLKVSYPNPSDRVLGKVPLGGDIMIHGNCLSIGCIALSDERIEELWVMTSSQQKAGRDVPVYLFPRRDMSSLPGDGEHVAFWDNLAEAQRAFAERPHVLGFRVDPDGSYVLTD